MLTDERLAGIRTRNEYAERMGHPAFYIVSARDVPALLAEVERLRRLVTTARALVECAQNLKPFVTFSLIDRRPLLDCPFCGSGRVNGGMGHDESCEWAEFAEAVRALDAP